jgi:hypothetical protein
MPLTNAKACARYYERHPERVTKANLAWRAANPERVKKLDRAWRTANPERRAYENAKQRCITQNPKFWKNYGGRGIKFLFTSFEQFFTELGPRPPGKDARGRALYSVDRKDNDGNYEPGNVRWATRAQQEANKRTTCQLSK